MEAAEAPVHATSHALPHPLPHPASPKSSHAASTNDIVQQLRDCLFAALDIALPALLRHAPDLAWEARTLAGRVRQAETTETLAQLLDDVVRRCCVRWLGRCRVR